MVDSVSDISAHKSRKLRIELARFDYRGSSHTIARSVGQPPCQSRTPLQTMVVPSYVRAGWQRHKSAAETSRLRPLEARGPGNESGAACEHVVSAGDDGV